MRSRQLHAAVTGSVAGTIYFDLPSDTTIRQVSWSASVTGPSAADYILGEVTTAASLQVSTNDAQGVLSVFSSTCVGGGSPANVMATALVTTTPCAWVGKRGDRIYLNVYESGGGTWHVRVLVWFD